MTNRTWLITGISSGFGRRMAERLLERGDQVAGTVRDLATVADLQQRYGGRLWAARLDLTETSKIRQVVDDAFAAFGTVKVVVSNAGYGLIGAAEEATDEQVAHQISTNLTGSIQLIRAALPHLREQGGGRILQLSSVAGQAVLPGASLYHAGKWGIEGFIDGLAMEVAAFGIGCTIVEPGAARTDFRFRSAQFTTPMAAYGKSPARFAHKMLADKANLSPGDPDKMVDAMIASVEQEPAPRRLALGSDAYAKMHEQLTQRLAALEAQRTLAASTDYPA
jgi:NAD(P)-dependent dehydrogenase (short-subunit alcohol dehydrogenase family)